MSARSMLALSAKLDTEWLSFTPLHEQTLDRARDVVFGVDGPFAGAIVGVYGSGKSTLAFTLLREAPEHGAAAVWDEAAPLIEHIVPGGERVLPQTFAARVRAWTGDLFAHRAARDKYCQDLRRRGHADIAARVGAQLEQGERRVVLLLDEVEQCHELLRQRISADDGQPLRALIDACGPAFRLLLAYAPESYHSVGDADRGRLAYLPVPALDVTSIQATFGLDRGAANFVWWVSRGRARGVMQAVRSVVEPFQRGALDHGLDDLGDALDALPGVFGVPALLRDGLSHGETRALLDLRPEATELGARGIVCPLSDRHQLADKILAELARRIDTAVDLQPVANELVAVLQAVGGDDDRAYLTMDDFRAAAQTAEARAIESGRQPEPIPRFSDQAVFAFGSLGELGPLGRRLRTPLATLCEARFPSPFTDPYLPLDGGRVPNDGELARRFRALSDEPAPLLVSVARDFVVFSNEATLAAWIDGGGLDGTSEPSRVVVVSSGEARPPLVELAVTAGRISVRDVGPFHATFLACLALRAAKQGSRSVETLSAESGEHRQLGRKIQWHLDRISLSLRDERPRPSPAWLMASRFVRDERFRSALARLKVGSPALLGLLVAVRPPPPAERRLLSRLAKILDAREPLRKIARLVNPGGRLSGAAVVVDELLPLGGEAPRWTERTLAGGHELGDLLDAFARDPTSRARISRWLLPEDHARLESLAAFHAGALPDISSERGQLDALQGLERTVRRAAAIADDIEVCTGKPRDTREAFKLGAVTDHVRGQSGPVDQLRALGAEVASAASTTEWVRALALWICGVFADRLLQGVEREQAELSEWEAAAATARDVGTRAVELDRALRDEGAEACAELVREGRRRIANHLETRDAFQRELKALRGIVTSLEALLTSLRAATGALRERGVSCAHAVATYLPDEDSIRAHQSLLRALPEALDEIEGPCPPPGGRSLIDYVELLRRHADATRRERLRMRLEATLDVALAPELRVDDDAVQAVERAWAALSPRLRSELAPVIRARPIEDLDVLERWLVQAEQKARVVGDWAPPASPRLCELDMRLGAWSLRLDVTAEEVREVDRQRTRASLAVSGLPTSLRPAVVDALVVDASLFDAREAHARIATSASGLTDAVGLLVGQLKAVGVGTPSELPCDTPEGALASLRARLSAAHESRDLSLAKARDLGAALSRWTEKPQAIPAEINLPQALRIMERETERLRALLSQKHEELAGWLAAHGLPGGLAPAPGTEVLAWSESLERATDRATATRPSLEALARLQPSGTLPPDGDTWDAVTAALADQLRRAKGAQRALARRFDHAAARARRLGGTPGPNDIESHSLAAAEAILAQLDAEIERLRAVKLRSCGDDARALYAAIRACDEGALSPPLAELLQLGLIQAAEDAT